MALDDDNLQFFIKDSQENLSEMGKILFSFEAGGEDLDDELVNKLIRAVRSIEGGADSVGLQNIKELTNCMGNALNLIYDKQIAQNSYFILVLLESVEVLSELIKDAGSSDEEDISGQLEKLKSAVKIVTKPKVLIADDQNFFRTVIRKMLLSLNCEVVGEAANGEEAVELFSREKPDLLFLDLHMPIKNGDKALEEIIGSCPDARVIMLTSVGDSDVVVKCLKLGAMNYILKGTTREKMKEVIEESIRIIQQ
jgi:two-component system, chemotaxis family, chemotaxis protein CheY